MVLCPLYFRLLLYVDISSLFYCNELLNISVHVVIIYGSLIPLVIVPHDNSSSKCCLMFT